MKMSDLISFFANYKRIIDFQISSDQNSTFQITKLDSLYIRLYRNNCDVSSTLRAIIRIKNNELDLFYFIFLFLFSFLFSFLFLDLELGVSVMSYITVTNCYILIIYHMIMYYTEEHRRF